MTRCIQGWRGGVPANFSRVPKSVGAKDDFGQFRSLEKHADCFGWLRMYDFLLVFSSRVSRWNCCQVKISGNVKPYSNKEECCQVLISLSLPFLGYLYSYLYSFVCLGGQVNERNASLAVFGALACNSLHCNRPYFVIIAQKLNFDWLIDWLIIQPPSLLDATKIRHIITTFRAYRPSKMSYLLWAVRLFRLDHQQ